MIFKDILRFSFISVKAVHYISPWYSHRATTLSLMLILVQLLSMILFAPSFLLVLTQIELWEIGFRTRTHFRCEQPLTFLLVKHISSTIIDLSVHN